MNNFENIRVVKHVFQFDGTVGNGANGSLTATNPYSGVNEALDTGEFVYQVYYDVANADPLTSGDAANTYLQIGLNVDDPDCIFDSTDGIVNTINTNGTNGYRTDPSAFAGATIDGRELVFSVGGTNDITGGTITIWMFIVRANVSNDGLDLLAPPEDIV